MRTLLAIGMVLVLLVGCAHTPQPYKTGSYKDATPELRALTHADAPPMPDEQRFWLAPPPWYAIPAVIGIVILQMWPIGVMLLLYAYAPEQ